LITLGMVYATAAVLTESTQLRRIDLIRAFAGITVTPRPVTVHGGAIDRRFQLARDVVVAGRPGGPAGRTACIAVGRQPFPLKP